MRYRRGVGVALVALGGWALLALLALGQEMFYVADHGGYFGRGEFLYWVTDWSTCALFTPVLLWLAHRFPIDRRRWRRHVPIVAAVTVLCVVVKCALLIAIYRLLVPDSTLMFRRVLVGNTESVLIAFWGFIGVVHAIEREGVASRLRTQLTLAQLEALKSQLHPHFLFNTLNGIATLMHRDADAADRMLTQLADLLRVTLQVSGTQEIPLTEEMALLDRYLSIVRTRFGDRLTVACDVDPGAEAALVPHFLLQPLVENALEHGIARRPGPGRLEIAARRDGDQLCVSVSDDGPGLEPQSAGNGGVGLTNTRLRLEQLYGGAHALALEAVAPTGVRATVVLPFHVRQ